MPKLLRRKKEVVEVLGVLVALLFLFAFVSICFFIIILLLVHCSSAKLSALLKIAIQINTKRVLLEQCLKSSLHQITCFKHMLTFKILG